MVVTIHYSSTWPNHPLTPPLASAERRRPQRRPPPRGGYMSPLTCPLPSPSTSRIRRLLPRLLMKLFLHHHPIGTIIDRIPSPRRRRSAIHAGRSINSIVRKITMISSASLRIKSSTCILQYPFKVGINHESEDLRNSIIVNSRSHNRQQQNIVAIR